MLFNSYVFVLLFLPAVLLLWWRLPRAGQSRLAMLVAASYLFYGWWDWRFTGLMAVSTLVDYWAGLGITRSTSGGARKRFLLLSVASNLGLLAFFKYAGFAAESYNAVATWIHHGGQIPVPEIVLPVGISFYTFQTMSYTIDLYRGDARCATSLLHFAAYVSMFPQLVAGPIVRYRDVDEQLSTIDRPIDWSRFAAGVWLFVIGLGQKLLFADPIAERIDPLLEDPYQLQFAAAWFAMLGYSCQLYFDFAGYSNMAVGLGRMLGFEFCQNFDSPYQASSIQDFWRRWHMSLSVMLRDYLFISLGGNRNGRLLTVRNLLIVMLLGGLWHGAGWTFVAWGAYHGVLLAGAYLWRGSVRIAIPRYLGQCLTFLAVVLGWTLFRCETIDQAAAVAGAMCGLAGLEASAIAAVGGLSAVGLLATLLTIVLVLPNAWRIRVPLNHYTGVAAALLLVICILRFDSASPFLYFRF